jgi:hypothetical protein
MEHVLSRASSAPQTRKIEMNQISLSEANDLLKKLFDERKSLATFFMSLSGTRVRLNGFLTGSSKDKGIFITSRPLPDAGGDWINVSPFREGECTFSYGEQREIAEDLRDPNSELGESALIITFLGTGQRFAIFFTL